jgi:hypothetical protein
MRLDSEAEVLYTRFKSLPVSHAGILELNLSLLRPSSFFLERLVNWFAEVIFSLQLDVLSHSLVRSHIIF